MTLAALITGVLPSTTCLSSAPKERVANHRRRRWGRSPAARPTIIVRVVLTAAVFYYAAEAITIYQRGVDGGDGHDNEDSLLEFVEVNRFFAPYVYGKYGYAMGALEDIVYDPTQLFVYGASETGYVHVIDYSWFPPHVRTSYGIDLEGKLSSGLAICPSRRLLFSSYTDGTDNGYVRIYRTANRNEETAPVLLTSVEVGPVPDKLSPNHDCTILAVGNEGTGVYVDDHLVDPEGSVSLIRDLESENPEVSHISFSHWTDEYLLSKGIHLSLPYNALEYWEKYHGLNFTEARSNYTAATNLEPEFLDWGPPESNMLFVSLQENSALIRVDVDKNEAVVIDSYGVKDWYADGDRIDILRDGGCDHMPLVPGLKTVRMPDSMASFVIDNRTYVVTANEGTDSKYGDFLEKRKAGELFDGNGTGKFTNFVADPKVFDFSDITVGTAAPFNSNCDVNNSETPYCVPDLRVTVGSTMVDYSDVDAPRIKDVVAIGSRGISIYQVPVGDDDEEKEEMTLIWDSGQDFEVEGCKEFPWAHNAIQDDDYAPLDGVLFETTEDEKLKAKIRSMNDPNAKGCNDRGDGMPGACPMSQTVDARSEMDGPAPESIVVGKACGRLYAVTVSEKSSVGYLYDLTDLHVTSAPSLVKVFHLSPESEMLSPGPAYDDGIIGPIDAESIVFLEREDSPTGNAGVLFGGAWSGVLSMWEFRCASESEDKAESILPSSNRVASGATAFFSSPWNLGTHSMSFSALVGFFGSLMWVA